MREFGDPVRVAVVGRGILASRAITYLTGRFGPDAVARGGEDASVVWLATSVESAAETLEQAGPAPDGLYFDFTAHSRGRDGHDPLQELRDGSRRLAARGVVTLPGCYAASVAGPLAQLCDEYGLQVRGLTAFSVGGRSTVGTAASAALPVRGCRVASSRSTGVHAAEIARHLSCDRSRTDLTIVVADLDDGILTRVTADVVPHGDGDRVPGAEGRRVFDVDTGTWRATPGGYDGLEAWPAADTTGAFAFALDGPRLDVVARVHNLDLPLALATAYLARAFRGQAIGAVSA